MPHALAIAARSPLGRAAARWRAGLRPTALKPLTYSVTHLMVAVLVAYALTRDWRVALGVGLIEPAVQTVAYVLHERAWSRVGSRRTRPAATSC
jgi:uncharacterized membrane protein